MDSPLAVLLRNGTHGAATVRLALKAEQFSVSIAKTPIQIPIPRRNPELLDLGIFRPAITLSGIIDTESTYIATTGNSPAGTRGMETLNVSCETYFIPYKNYLEEVAMKWVTDTSTTLQIEWGDTTTPVSTNSANATGGALYHVAIQQAQFSVLPAQEDRWQYTMQFIAKGRNDITF